ncbi:hypothetical protein VNO77_02122 [Canavalia gladiata]|uniref:Uncharacterized protein n=1 Tax=Canavalia gladiata TaxID=3824 RepID=A0AAN9MYU0_CANGL
MEQQKGSNATSGTRRRDVRLARASVYHWTKILLKFKWPNLDLNVTFMNCTWFAMVSASSQPNASRLLPCDAQSPTKLNRLERDKDKGEPSNLTLRSTNWKCSILFNLRRKKSEGGDMELAGISVAGNSSWRPMLVVSKGAKQ